MNLRKLVSIFALPLMLVSGAASATIITTGATADDWFSSNSTYTAFNLSGNPSDGYLRTFGVPGVNRSALEFSLAGITPGSNINSAIFSIQSRGTAVAGGIFQFFGYSGDGLITVADATQTANLISTTPTLAGAPLYTVNVTSFIQSLINSNATYAGILIKLAVEGDFLGNDLVSSEATYSSSVDVPKLMVDFDVANKVPAPTSLLLIGIALLGFGATRKFKK